MRRQLRLGLVDFDVDDGGQWFGDRVTVFCEAFQVEGDGFVDVAFRLRWRRAGGDAAGEEWHGAAAKIEEPGLPCGGPGSNSLATVAHLRTRKPKRWRDGGGDP